MVSVNLKPMITNLDLLPTLIALFDFGQKRNLNQPVWTFLVSTYEMQAQKEHPHPVIQMQAQKEHPHPVIQMVVASNSAP